LPSDNNTSDNSIPSLLLNSNIQLKVSLSCTITLETFEINRSEIKIKKIMRFGVSSFMMAAAMTVVVCLVGSASAFVQPSGKTSSLNSVASQQAKDPLHILPPDATDIPYGEESRKFRRTVYTHDDWIKHRSPDRFFKTLRTTTTSGIYKVRYLAFVFLS
jgi:hypothetical protein